MSHTAVQPCAKVNRDVKGRQNSCISVAVLRTCVICQEISPFWKTLQNSNECQKKEFHARDWI